MRETRKKTREIQAIERRKQLLEMAKKLFAERGYHGTTTKAINESIGMADGLLYHYFPGGKLQILHAIFEEEIDRKIGRIKQELQKIAEIDELKDVLFQIGSLLMKYAVRDRELLIIYLKERSLLDPALLQRSIHQLCEVWREICALIEAKIDERHFHQFDPSMMVNQFVGAIIFYLAQNIYFPEKSRSRKRKEQFLCEWVRHTLATWTK
ncbi:TetR/AcrR family transcriptional regulator [Thermoactinomyces daqus]|nr:TetR/AcrR family transcriptional regulator [Thermoactinomyces daqus]